MKRVTLEEQAQLQNLEVPEDHAILRYETVQRMYDAVKLLANKALPTKASRIHVAKCARVLKVVLDEEYSPERQRIQETHRPSQGTVIEDSDTVAFRDPIGMSLELSELNSMVTVVKLPKRITDDMLPVNSKVTPNNEDGLSAILADLGPLYPLEDEA